ncbi:MAG: hypothetical protein WC712_06410 [Candidatus Brocadiia bacterium]
MSGKLRLVLAAILFVAAAGSLCYAGMARYRVYPYPAEQDLRKVDPAQASDMSQYGLIERASFDGITRFPAPPKVKANAPDAEWVFVEKARQAACVT